MLSLILKAYSTPLLPWTILAFSTHGLALQEQSISHPRRRSSSAIFESQTMQESHPKMDQETVQAPLLPRHRHQQTSFTWHAIIVGAGPGGCSAARTLVDQGVNATKILMVERGPSLQAFKDKPNYTNALAFGLTQQDPDFRENIQDSPIVLGNGVGGGTNIFGMQFIDQSEVSNATTRQDVAGSDIQGDVDTFASFAQATTYSDDDYTDLGVKDNYDNLYAKINNVLGSDGMSYRNKVYRTGNDLANQTRLTVGDLIPVGVTVRSGEYFLLQYTFLLFLLIVRSHFIPALFFIP